MKAAVLFCVVSLLAVAIADDCPTFAGQKTACSANTCGHFPFKGKFRSKNSAKTTQISTNTNVKDLATCCNMCRTTPGCIFYNYLLVHKVCRLMNYLACDSVLRYNATKPANFRVNTNKFTNKFIRYYPRYPRSFVGGRCNTPSIVNDPHLVGARGTPFDFNGLPDKTFCLVSDKDLHINMLLSGYFDERKEGATAFQNGKAIRTWIKVLGIMWRRHGEQHSITMTARKGAQQERGNGYMDAIEVDGTAVPRLALGDELNLYNGQASITFEGYEKVGPYDVDLYKLRIEGLLTAEVRLRVAHPLLQQPDDAQVHLSMDIQDMAYTPSVHGVLGQTYRADREERALNYTALASLMKAPIAADMESGKGFLDGVSVDYESSGVLNADCQFSQFAPKAGSTDPLDDGDDMTEALGAAAMPLKKAKTSVVSEDSLALPKVASS